MEYPAAPMTESTKSEDAQSTLAGSERPVETLQAFCGQILLSGDLETKLTAPDQASALLDAPGAAARIIDAPKRDVGLRMSRGSERLPRPGQLTDRAHRIQCLSRFAHHELMAVELFAWALLRWPDLPGGLRRGLLSALVDEQRHCRLYLERLEAQGGRFDTDDHSDYFWQQAPAIADSPHGPSAFLAAMGLTLEQANLDFTLTYRDGFAQAGDTESAAVCQRVHDEEIAHVALALRWLARLDPAHEESAEADLARYLDCVPFPLGPARAKGRRFDVSSRRKAGLPRDWIEHIRTARSPQEYRPSKDESGK
jgi:uncharacterized ferritin-like protein (DUF455 family)